MENDLVSPLDLVGNDGSSNLTGATSGNGTSADPSPTTAVSALNSINLATLVGNLAYLDEVYAQFRANADAIDPSLRSLFEESPANSRAVALKPSPGNGRVALVAPASEVTPRAPASAVSAEDALWVGKVWALVHYYRARGHLEAELDPLGLQKREPHPELDPRAYGFTDADLDREVPAGIFGPASGATANDGVAPLTLREVIRRCRMTYCRAIGVEFMHMSSPARKAWLQDRMEANLNQGTLDRATKLAILDRIARAEAFERFVHAKYVGTKRFSLEGSETVIPLLDLALEHASALGVQEVVLGMAHRGRLNILAQIMGKAPRDLFAEFEDIDPESTLGAGDVKYHLGYSSDYISRAGKKMHLSLAFNPSHLEAVDPVVVGRVRAKQRRHKDLGHEKVLGILVHGDAAFAGQGLVAETLNLSEIHGYRTGGTLHVIINNQIGFTATPDESRSTPYATDVAKMLQCPIFHVNGDVPEAVAEVILLAMEYRAQHHGDVVVDMFCYRKYGHNESDEPSFTQPLMYRVIEKKDSIFKIYADQLIREGTTSKTEVDGLLERVNSQLEVELKAAKATAKRPSIGAGAGVWQGYLGGPDLAVPEVDTGVSRERLAELGLRATSVPEGFHLHPKVERLYKQRLQMARGEALVDWGFAEILSFASLATEKRVVRVSGQDSGRGTFSSRHAIVVDVENGQEYTPLQNLETDQADCRIYDSALSEAAVLGFEFGYSLDYPDALVAWEAQFGDFANGAQVIIDQFISSSEDKWKRISGLTMLLPHGYEGQGPEHSSARPERFLQLCAEDNMQVVYPTTAAQYFHVLRRQVHRPWRKPLIVLAPKSLLRAASASSPIDELATGRFQRVIGDTAVEPSAVRRVLFCWGKIYFDLVEERKRRNDVETAIVRLEQLYPWRDDLVLAALAPFTNLRDVAWVQEEPSNMGALFFVEPRLRKLLDGAGKTWRQIARVESASPATGSHKAHVLEQKALLAEAFK